MDSEVDKDLIPKISLTWIFGDKNDHTQWDDHRWIQAEGNGMLWKGCVSLEKADIPLPPLKHGDKSKKFMSGTRALVSLKGKPVDSNMKIWISYARYKIVLFDKNGNRVKTFNKSRDEYNYLSKGKHWNFLVKKRADAIGSVDITIYLLGGDTLNFSRIPPGVNESDYSVIEVEGQQFQVQKEILSNASPFFAAMLNDDFKEKLENRAVLTGLTASQFLAFLTNLQYGGGVCAENYKVMLQLGDMWDCKQVLTEVDLWMKRANYHVPTIYRLFLFDKIGDSERRDALVGKASTRVLMRVQEHEEYGLLSDLCQKCIEQEMQGREKRMGSRWGDENRMDVD